MKKILPITIIIILIISGLGVVAQPNNTPTLEKNLSLSLSEPQVIEKEKQTSIILDEATTYLNNPGRPALPIVTKVFTFPIGTIITDVACNPVNIQQKSIGSSITYAQKPLIRCISQNTVEKTSKDTKIYASEELYPDRWYDYTINVGLEGDKQVTFVTIKFYPIRYSPKNDIIHQATTADIKIQYETQNAPLKLADEYDLVIITPMSFSRSLQSLVTHKENMGIKTKIVTTQHIYLNFEGRDRAEKIKYFIKNAKEEWGISYVLLVGGMKGQRFWSWHVPVRYSNLDDASDFETSYVSDLYYADLYKYSYFTGIEFDDWDSNENGVFAEWNTDSKDILDMYPDVYIGRLPCRHKYEVRRIVDRIINYETNTYGESWFNKMVVLGGDSFNDQDFNTSTDYAEGKIETEHALSFMPGFEHIRIWPEGGDITFTTENAIEELSEGQGFVYFTGHGNPSSWVTFPHGDFETNIPFRNQDIKKLSNKDKLPIVIVGGCHNCQFDCSLLRFLTKGRLAYYYGELTTKCWGWLYASLPGGGSIASIGNTGLGYGTIGDGPQPPDEIPEGAPDGIPDCIQYLGGWIEPHFFEVYNNENIDILGEVHGNALIDYLQNFSIDWGMDWDDHENSPTLVDCKTVQQWVLFGDPSLKIGGYP